MHLNFVLIASLIAQTFARERHVRAKESYGDFKSGWSSDLKTEPTDISKNHANDFYQMVTIFSEFDQQGAMTTLYSFTPDLSWQSFDNMASSMEVTGVWIFYEETYYNRGFQGKMVAWGWGDRSHYNFQQINDKSSSTRFAGDQYDWRTDVLSMYYEPYFGGVEEYFYNDSPTIPEGNFGEAMILTGKMSEIECLLNSHGSSI